MKRTKHRKTADAILCSDMHLREDQPICRMDNFWDAQWKKVEFLMALQKEHNCPILHAGDLFHHWKPSPFLLGQVIENLPKHHHFYTAYGQHDLPQHNYELREKSGIYVLEKAGRVNTYNRLDLRICNWNENPLAPPYYKSSQKTLLWHTPVYYKENPYHSDNVSTAFQLLRKYPQFNLIVTGDNHIPFITEYDGRLLVNPGSFTRQAVNETHEPRVYLYYADSNRVEPVILPHKRYVISREHLEKIEQRDSRIEDFISKLNDDYDATLSFEENMNLFITDNDIRESVVRLIYKAMNL